MIGQSVLKQALVFAEQARKIMSGVQTDLWTVWLQIIYFNPILYRSQVAQRSWDIHEIPLDMYNVLKSSIVSSTGISRYSVM